MIKVQPAHSRIRKEESPDRLALTRPRTGLLSAGGVALFVGVGWTAAALWGKSQVHKDLYEIAFAALVLPGIVFLTAGLAQCLKGWSFVRSADTLTFTRSGLWGSRVRTWPAQDVSSCWVEEVKAPRETRHVFVVGFRNGRSEDVLSDPDGEDLRWVAAMLKDARGIRRPTPNTGRAAAEPVPRRMDPSVEPVSILARRFPTGGAELALLPLIDSKRRWLKLLGVVCGGLIAILAAGSLLAWLMGESSIRGISRLAVGGLLVWAFLRFRTLNRTATITIGDGLVQIVQNQHRGNHEFPVVEVEFVQTFRASGDTELQFLLNGRPKLRLFKGRPADELEWAARFLRVALKHRTEEEVAPLQVDASVGECQVCSEKMESRVVYCGKCRTPHHEECWSYVGQCSTYGCREIRFTRA